MENEKLFPLRSEHVGNLLFAHAGDEWNDRRDGSNAIYDFYGDCGRNSKTSDLIARLEDDLGGLEMNLQSPSIGELERFVAIFDKLALKSLGVECDFISDKSIRGLTEKIKQTEMPHLKDLEIVSWGKVRSVSRSKQISSHPPFNINALADFIDSISNLPNIERFRFGTTADIGHFFGVGLAAKNERFKSKAAAEEHNRAEFEGERRLWVAGDFDSWGGNKINELQKKYILTEGGSPANWVEALADPIERLLNKKSNITCFGQLDKIVDYMCQDRQEYTETELKSTFAERVTRSQVSDRVIGG